MTRLLHVAASARGAASFSRRVAESLIASLCRLDPGLIVVERDLAAAPPPHPDRDFVRASLMTASDLVVLSTPMHNFTAPSALKAWLDHVVRPGRTFRTTAAGKLGLLGDRPVRVVIACGGPFGEGGGAAQLDFLTPYLRYAFAVIGLSSFEALRLEELNRGDERIERALEAARRWIEAQGAGLAIDGRR